MRGTQVERAPAMAHALGPRVWSCTHVEHDAQNALTLKQSQILGVRVSGWAEAWCVLVSPLAVVNGSRAFCQGSGLSPAVCLYWEHCAHTRHASDNTIHPALL